MHYSFDKDIIDGRKAEYLFMYLMIDALARDDKILPSHTDYRGKDIIVKLQCGKEFTFEIKNDMKAQETGNIGIEFECRGNSSGISITASDYWVHFYDNEFWVIPTGHLRRLIEENKYFRIAVGGDKGSNTKMYLFTKRDFQKYANKLDTKIFKEWFEKLNAKYSQY